MPLHTQQAAIRFHARPIGDARQLASASQDTYLAGKPSNVCFAELRAGRVFLRGHSGSEGCCLRLVPSLRPLPSGLRSSAPQPPPSGRCWLRRQRLPASPDWRRPRAKRKPKLLLALDGVRLTRFALRAKYAS